MATKILPMDIPANEAASIEAAIQGNIAEINRLLERIKRTQARIDKLDAATTVIRSRVEARMAKLCGKSS